MFRQVHAYGMKLLITSTISSRIENVTMMLFIIFYKNVHQKAGKDYLQLELLKICNLKLLGTGEKQFLSQQNRSTLPYISIAVCIDGFCNPYYCLCT